MSKEKSVAKPTATGGALDKFKWLIVVLIIALAIIANIYLEGTLAGAERIAGMIVLGIVAILVAMTTTKGRIAWSFLKDARMEMRKVVWPTRQETMQTTLLVIAFVAVMSLILWGVDSLFALIVSKIIL